jgi:hypothetical protein
LGGDADRASPGELDAGFWAAPPEESSTATSAPAREVLITADSTLAVRLARR